MHFLFEVRQAEVHRVELDKTVPRDVRLVNGKNYTNGDFAWSDARGNLPATYELTIRARAETNYARFVHDTCTKIHR